MSLKLSYTLLAPIYDWVAAPAFDAARRESLRALQGLAPGSVFLNGIGTGLDLAYLPPQHHYTGLDLTRAMLAKAIPRARQLEVIWVQGDSHALPFRDGAFDCAVLHLILAVVSHPEFALAEAARVLKAGGTLIVLDKFLHPGARAPLRRLVSPLLGRIATRTDVELEPLLAAAPELSVLSDEPALARGWFRRIRLLKHSRPPHFSAP